MNCILKMKFGTASGEKTFSFPNAKQSPSREAVRTLAERMIANGSIYRYPPLEIHSAVVQVITENPVDLS